MDDLVSKSPDETSNYNEFFKENKIYSPQILNYYSYALNNPLIYMDPSGESFIRLFFDGVKLFFSDIPVAGDPGDNITDDISYDYDDGDIKNNFDDAVYNRMKGNLPWQIKVILGTYEFVFVNTFGEERHVEENEIGSFTYTVQSGDTMYELFGDDYQNIADYNNMEDPDHISVGQEIRIPLEDNPPSN